MSDPLSYLYHKFPRRRGKVVAIPKATAGGVLRCCRRLRYIPWAIGEWRSGILTIVLYCSDNPL